MIIIAYASLKNPNYICVLFVFFCLQMDQLELKLANELPSSAKVVACRFPFPTWVPESTEGEGIDTVWVYDAKTFQSALNSGKTRNTSLENKPNPHK